MTTYRLRKGKTRRPPAGTMSSMSDSMPRNTAPRPIWDQVVQRPPVHVGVAEVDAQHAESHRAHPLRKLRERRHRCHLDVSRHLEQDAHELLRWLQARPLARAARPTRGAPRRSAGSLLELEVASRRLHVAVDVRPHGGTDVYPDPLATPWSSTLTL